MQSQFYSMSASIQNTCNASLAGFLSFQIQKRSVVMLEKKWENASVCMPNVATVE